MMKGRLVGLNQVLPKSLSPLYQAASSKLPSFRPPALPDANPKNSIQIFSKKSRPNFSFASWFENRKKIKQIMHIQLQSPKIITSSWLLTKSPLTFDWF